MTRGVRRIVRLNWPFYAAAGAAIAAATTLLAAVPLPLGARAAVLMGLGAAAFWTVGSLLASWIVYDRSPLMRWRWIRDAIGVPPVSWINLHAGLDESTAALRRLFAGSAGRVFDIFDPAEMTEPSIARARARLSDDPDAPAAERVDYRDLPVQSGTVDVAFLLLSAHELRTDTARAALFAELRRVLIAGGRVVVAEHLRDAANFFAFGPGHLHFHSWRTWVRAFASARFAIGSEFSITPFVHVFILRRLS
jgi:SAM-dependent methyltransferase